MLDHRGVCSRFRDFSELLTQVNPFVSVQLELIQQFLRRRNSLFQTGLSEYRIYAGVLELSRTKARQNPVGNDFMSPHPNRIRTWGYIAQTHSPPHSRIAILTDGSNYDMALEGPMAPTQAYSMSYRMVSSIHYWQQSTMRCTFLHLTISTIQAKKNLYHSFTCWTCCFSGLALNEF